MIREKRFFVRDQDFKSKRIVLSSEESHHLKNVLRGKKGDPVILFNGEGEEFTGQVASLGPGNAVIAIEKKRRERIRGAISIVLVQALPKKKKMDFVIAKACELGVEEVMPLETDRTECKLGQAQLKRVSERWERIAVQSCKQSCLDWVPLIHPPATFKEMIHRVKGFEAVLIPHPDEAMPKFSEVIAEVKARVGKTSKPAMPRKIAVVIGPEGGFSDREIALANEHGLNFVYLGDLVLRTETASIVAVSLVKYAFNLC
ncbi:MAG TPA: 16S rRNA (uracil(1498)-N(3))-methyltransferase [Candidatus Omnitrophota bacterium]|nr:16S rRNA (uracil(1498)-N(3))-methyltransferase [Candidatus Omnitrophota bacterium]